MRKPKAHPLPASTRAEIGRRYESFKEKNIPTSYNSMAEMYNCTPEQVRKAVADYKAGAFEGRRGRTKTKKRTAGGSAIEAENAFRGMLDDAALDLAADENLTTIERIQMAHKLAATRNLEQKSRIMRALKNLNGQYLIAIVRYFQPDYSESECLAVLRHVEERWKATL